MNRVHQITKFALYLVSGVVAITVCIFIIIGLVTTPSNNRVWLDDQALLAQSAFDGDVITISNIRNFEYTSPTTYTPHYYDATFNLNNLKRVWYIVTPFEGIPGSAHTFLSFEFENERFVAISVEIRKEQDESFHPIKGLFNTYELIYVVADERDVIKRRSNYDKDRVYVYPTTTTNEAARALFVDMLTRANTLTEKPEFYNTLTNSCTSNLVAHINAITPHRVPFWSLRVLFPADSDELAYELGLLDTELSFDEAREHYLINDRAVLYADSPDFSTKIRVAE